jgi:hypothetical protein
MDLVSGNRRRSYVYKSLGRRRRDRRRREGYVVLVRSNCEEKPDGNGERVLRVRIL